MKKEAASDSAPQDAKKKFQWWSVVIAGIALVIVFIVTIGVGLLYTSNTLAKPVVATSFTQKQISQIKELYSIPDSIDAKLIKYKQTNIIFRGADSELYFYLSKEQVDLYLASLESRWYTKEVDEETVIVMNNKDYRLVTKYGGGYNDVIECVIMVFQCCGQSYADDDVLVYIYDSAIIPSFIAPECTDYGYMKFDYYV